MRDGQQSPSADLREGRAKNPTHAAVEMRAKILNGVAIMHAGVVAAGGY
jgi:hypothetical protein